MSFGGVVCLGRRRREGSYGKHEWGFVSLEWTDAERYPQREKRHPEPSYSEGG